MATVNGEKKIEAPSGVAADDTSQHRPPEFIYVILPEELDPFERMERYEHHLEVGLQASGLGDVGGGGTQLGKQREDGTRPILWCGIDVDVFDVSEGRAWLRERLPTLGCLAGTRIQYFENDKPLEDEFDGKEWNLNQRRRD